MSWILTNTLAAFLLPPLNFLIITCIGLALRRKHPRTGTALLSTGLALTWVFSMPVTGDRLLRVLERGAHTDIAQMRDAQAIVVLAGGSYFNAPEYGGDTISYGTLERLRLGALLHRRTGLPILVTGGNPDGGQVPDAVMMKRTLEQEFQVPVDWTESTSDNTRQNALNSREILSREKIDRVVLITHGWHMPRARNIFERAGFQVIPAGTGFHNDEKLNVVKFIPSADGLRLSWIFFHEVIGMAWYFLR